MRHCWKSATAELVSGSKEWHETWTKYPKGATCMLPDGHEGPCEFIPDDEITITFQPDQESER